MKYLYEVVDRAGESSKGAVEASSEREALRRLSANDQVVVSLVLHGRQLERKAGRIAHEELLLVLQELAALLKSKVSLIDSIQSLADGHENASIVYCFEEIAHALQKGKRFSEALRESKFELPEYMYLLVSAGEATGKLADSLGEGVAQMEYENDLATETKNSLMYPAVLVVAGILAIGTVFTVVVPKFSNLLDSPENLPGLAYFVLTTGMFINSNNVLIAVVLFLVVGSLIYLLRLQPVRQKILDYLVSFPIVGAWLVESEAGRWTGLLGTLLGNGVDLIEALELSNSGLVLGKYRSRFEQVVRSVRNGVSLSVALQEHQALTPMSYHILKVGESSGQMPQMLRSVSSLYSRSGKNRMKRALTLIEPIAILLIGGIIGIVILGVMLAITSAADVPL